MRSDGKKFDLNIEEILEDWEVHHAIREIIANALDEQLLTGSKNIDIFRDAQGKWHIKDYGRGLKYQHLTQKENEEKLRNPNVIGKFGIGLKDALATFERNSVKVLIKSRFGEITLERSEKHGFADVVTLHALITPPSDPHFIGTEVILDGVTEEDIARAKDLFLMFSGERVLESTKYGQVLEKKSATGQVYINGVLVAEEPNFLFSYNITSLTSSIRKALNRERSNVGRTAYAERIKAILLACKSKEVAERLTNDLGRFESGEIHDELKWLDVQQRAVQILNAQKKVVFLTPLQLASENFIVDEARRSGFTIIAIPENLSQRIKGLQDIAGTPIRDLDRFHSEYTESFEYKFVDSKDLNPDERRIFAMTDRLFQLLGGKPPIIKAIAISETMRKEINSEAETTGVWDPATGTIIVKRSQLKNTESYFATLLHEVAHAISGSTDVSRDFEAQLTKLLGLLAAKAIESRLW